MCGKTRHGRRGVLGTLSSQHALTLAYLLCEIYMGLTTLCGTNFQSVGPAWISPNKQVSVRENVEKKVFLALHDRNRNDI